MNWKITSEENILNMPFDVLGAYDFYILGDVLEHLSVDYAQWLIDWSDLNNSQSGASNVSLKSS